MRGEDWPTVGFDFGTSTTHTASAGGIVPIGRTSEAMPSVVGYADDGAVVVGEDALDLPAEQTVRSIKRSITERRDFVRVDTPGGIRDVRADDLIIEVIKEAARRGTEAELDMTREGQLWLGCPAMWDGRQRRRLLALAGNAGLPVALTSFVDEPVAAGIAWLAEHRSGAAGPQRVLVFDMGGGTLDIAVLDVRGINHRDVSVLAALGVAEAGDALDEAIAEDLDYVLGAAGVDIDALSNPERARARLPYAATAAKIALTTSTETDVKLSRRLFGIGSIPYTRDQLNAAFEPQIDRAEDHVAAALRIARLTDPEPASAYNIARTPIENLVESVGVVVLAGGMSQIPYVAERMRKLFPPTTRVELATSPSDNAVALGLAQAAHYGRISMYRPAFDVLLEWDQGREFRTIYDAYTPLVEAWQIVRGGRDLRYTRTGLDLSLPRKGRGHLRVVSHSDERIRAMLGGQRLDRFPVALSEQRFEFSIYPNGRVRMTDGSGTYEGHVGDW